MLVFYALFWPYNPREEMKATQGEIKQNVQGINSEGKETGTQISSLKQKEDINIQPERIKK